MSDHAIIHNHIEFNSTALDCSHKFNNVKNNFIPLRKANDRICQEFSLSIIENPEEKGKHYGEWAAEKNGQSWKSLLWQTIDRVLPTASTLDEFLEAMRREGYEVVQSSKLLKFRAQGQERFTRSKILGADYTQEVLRDCVDKAKQPRRKKKIHLEKDTRINFLMDIQARLQGRGPGMERWMKIHNLKEAADKPAFRAAHETDLLLHEAAKRAFDIQGVKKLPTAKMLQAKRSHHNLVVFGQTCASTLPGVWGTPQQARKAIGF